MLLSIHFKKQLRNACERAALPFDDSLFELEERKRRELLLGVPDRTRHFRVVQHEECRAWYLLAEGERLGYVCTLRVTSALGSKRFVVGDEISDVGLGTVHENDKCVFQLRDKEKHHMASVTVTKQYRRPSSIRAIVVNDEGDELAMQNRLPTWNSDTGKFELRFASNVTLASKANFQLEDLSRNTIMEFGVCGPNQYVMEVRAPLCAMHALGVVAARLASLVS